MFHYLFVLGRKTEISTCEIQAVFKDSKIITQNSSFLLLESPKKLDTSLKMQRLGGTIKIAKVLNNATPLRGQGGVKTSEPTKLNQKPDYLHSEKKIITTITDYLTQKYPNQKKIKFGLHLLNLPVRQLNTYLIGIKKALKPQGFSGRFINKNLKNTSLPAIIGEGFLRGKGSEFLIAKDENEYIIAETEAAQDIDKYSLRDYEKPFRDARMGMLPPKLAQILINLSNLKEKQTLWDPFCGSGTVLMEGLLQNLKVIGSDINPDNINGTNQNLWWLCKQFNLPQNYQTFTHDVTKPLTEKIHFDAIICEGYLGKPKRALPNPNALAKEILSLEELYGKFFTNISPFIQTGQNIIICLPCFRDKGKYIFLKNILEKIRDFGYTLNVVGQNQRGTLIYDRKDQIVGREILSLTKI